MADTARTQLEHAGTQRNIPEQSPLQEAIKTFRWAADRKLTHVRIEMRPHEWRTVADALAKAAEPQRPPRMEEFLNYYYARDRSALEAALTRLGVAP